MDLLTKILIGIVVIIAIAVLRFLWKAFDAFLEWMCLRDETDRHILRILSRIESRLGINDRPKFYAKEVGSREELTNHIERIVKDIKRPPQ